MTEGAPGYRTHVESDRVIVQLTGRLMLGEMKAARQAAAELARERRLSRILIDLTPAAPSSAKMVDIYELGSSERMVVPPGTTIAVVYRPDQVSAEDAEFAESVSGNRGGTLRAFSDLEAARRWLS